MTRGMVVPDVQERTTVLRLAFLGGLAALLLAALLARLWFLQVLAGDRFARFMMDAASPTDLFWMIASLPKPPFLLGAARVGRGCIRR